MALLRRLGAMDRPVLPLIDAAFAFAELARPGIDTSFHRRHLSELGQAVGQAAAEADGFDERAEALGTVIADAYGYRGDTETYDDLDNADLIRVIDRRRGLPVTLGILYLHVARLQGWSASGLDFPGHFLIRLEEGKQQIILDPFGGGVSCDAERVAELLRGSGSRRPPDPRHLRSVSDREVLLRLENNIKSRLIQANEAESAVAVIERMLLLAPDHGGLWYEAGVIDAHLDRLAAASTALAKAVEHAETSAQRDEAALLLRQIRGRLN